MWGRTVLVAYTAGVAAVQTLSTLPGRSMTAFMLVGAVVCVIAAWCGRRWWWTRRGRRRIHGCGPASWKAALGLPCERDLDRVCDPDSDRARARGHSHDRGRPWLIWALCMMAAVSTGFAYASTRAHNRLADSLACQHRDRVQRLDVVIAGLPMGDAQRRRVVVEVSADRPKGVPRHIAVTWNAAFRSKAPLPELIPGQRWRMALLLRPPRASMNPTGIDGEASMFSQGIRATGRVRGQPQLLGTGTTGRPDIWVQRMRYSLRQQMQASLGDARYAGLIVALALGDQSKIAYSDRQVLNRSGIAHLVAISGLHIGWVVALVVGVTTWFWRRLMWPARWTKRRAAYAASTHIPAQTVAAIAAWVAAIAYCSLAGWGIPARRVFIMLTVFLAALLCRLPCGGWRALALAAALVVTAHPWAPLSAGFWLSFAAVAAILAVVDASAPRQPAPAKSISRTGITISPADSMGLAVDSTGVRAGKRVRDLSYRDRPDFLYVDPPLTRAAQWHATMAARWEKARQALIQAGRIQWVITLSLAPLLAAGMGNVSLVSPLANALAIPVMGALGTPLTLAFAVACLLAPQAIITTWLGTSAHALLATTMAPVTWLAQRDHAAWPVAAETTSLTILALVGVFYALLPRGLPLRRTAWLLVLPLLLVKPAAMRAGEWRLVALDIGQGGAVIVKTARHTVVFDTGLAFGDGSDSGARVIAPYLMAQGRHYVDRLIVSHRHADHYGGVAGLLDAVPVRLAHAPFDLNVPIPNVPPIVSPLSFQACAAGMSWTYDEVRFTFLHPPVGRTYTQAQANASSCVMRIEGAHHKAVLTGDIGKREEDALLNSVGMVHVALVAHHGSASSSSQAWVDAVGAWHAISQNGYRNRFDHPAPVVARRWQRSGAAFWRNDLDGAVQANSTADALSVFSWRDRRMRYWHEPLTKRAEESCRVDRRPT